MRFHRAAVAGGSSVAALAVGLQVQVDRWELTGLLVIGSLVGFGLLLMRRQTGALLRAQQRAVQSTQANERVLKKLRADQRVAIREVRSDLLALERLVAQSSRQQTEESYALTEQIADLNVHLMALRAELTRLTSIASAGPSREAGPVLSVVSAADAIISNG